MSSPFIYTSKKGIDYSAFGGFEGFLQATSNGAGNMSTSALLGRVVPDLAHGISMTAVAVSSLPFEIVDKSDAVVDSSENWKNKVGGLPDPTRTLYLIAASLCGGSAYLFPTATNKMVADLQYFAPNTIMPWIDINGLQWFQRTSDKGSSEKIMPENLLYFWLPDKDVELGPALNHPLGNALLAATGQLNMNAAINVMAERGFIPPTMLGAKGMPAGDERKKTEDFFNRFLRGWNKVIAKVINTEALSVVQLGAGMDALKTSYVEIKRDMSEEIAKCFGIPFGLFISDAAFASEYSGLQVQWYTSSIFKTIYQTIEGTFNTQLFNKWNYRLLFRPERLNAFQEDENSRAGSVVSYTNAINTNAVIAKLVMDFMGVDLSEDQAAQLDAMIAEKKANAEKVQEQIKQGQENKQEELKKQPEPLDTDREEKPVKSITLTADETKDLALWRQMATRFFRKGKGCIMDFECKALSEEMAAPIRQKLATAKSERDIVNAFEIDSNLIAGTLLTAEPNKDILALADAINNAVRVTATPLPEYDNSVHS